MEIIHDAPEATSYVPVSEHQSQTPASFYSGPPVLYYQCSSAHLVILDSELKLSPALSKLSDNQVIGAEAATNGDSGNHQDEEVVISSVEIWVTSEYFRPSATWTHADTMLENSFFTVKRPLQDYRFHIPAYHCTLYKDSNFPRRPMRYRDSSCRSPLVMASTTTIPTTRFL